MNAGYPTIRLGEAVDRVTKGTTPTTHGYPYTDEGVSFLRVENLQNGVVDISKARTFISPDADRFLKRSTLESGDVLLSIAGTIGRVAIVRDHDVPANTNQAVAIIRGAAKRFEPVFLRYALESPLLHGLITKEARGGAMQNISLENVRNVVVPLPSLPEQRRIVAEIEKQFTRLDAGVAALRRVQANLKRYRASVLKAACEGRLAPTEAELAKTGKRKAKSESGDALLARILAERRQNWKGRGRYKEPAAPNTTNLPGLPEGWTWASPEQLSAAEPYSLAIGPFGSNLKVSDYTSSGVPLVFVRNIRSGRFGDERTVFVSQQKGRELRAHTVRGGEVLITKMGDPPGDACLYPDSEPDAVITADCIKLSLSLLLPRKRFFVHAINSEVVRPQLQLITKGVAQMKVSLGRFGTLAIPLPPLPEQTRIVAEVERRLSVIEDLESVVSANLQRGIRLRQSILQKAFTGALV